MTDHNRNTANHSQVDYDVKREEKETAEHQSNCDVVNADRNKVQSAAHPTSSRQTTTKCNAPTIRTVLDWVREANPSIVLTVGLAILIVMSIGWNYLFSLRAMEVVLYGVPLIRFAWEADGIFLSALCLSWLTCYHCILTDNTRPQFHVVQGIVLIGMFSYFTFLAVKDVRDFVMILYHGK